jgi:hypothetical protein
MAQQSQTAMALSSGTFAAHTEETGDVPTVWREMGMMFPIPHCTVGIPPCGGRIGTARPLRRLRGTLAD